MIDKIVTYRRILGIDPGTLFMGYALLDVQNNKSEVMKFDVFDVHKMPDHFARLQKEFFFLQELVETYKPTELAVETQFVDKNPQSMIKIVQAQTIAIAVALSHDLPIYEYTPLKVKMAITGNGRASKEQIADMLQRFLHLPKENMPKKLDATDALGIAYCHFLQCGLPQSDKKTPKDWTTFAKQKGLVQPTNSPNAKLLQLLKTKK